jgi:hypothetical protein
MRQAAFACYAASVLPASPQDLQLQLVRACGTVPAVTATAVDGVRVFLVISCPVVLLRVVGFIEFALQLCNMHALYSEATTVHVQVWQD